MFKPHPTFKNYPPWNFRNWGPQNDKPKIEAKKNTFFFSFSPSFLGVSIRQTSRGGWKRFFPLTGSEPWISSLQAPPNDVTGKGLWRVRVRWWSLSAMCSRCCRTYARWKDGKPFHVSLFWCFFFRQSFHFSFSKSQCLEKTNAFAVFFWWKRTLWQNPEEFNLWVYHMWIYECMNINRSYIWYIWWYKGHISLWSC